MKKLLLSMLVLGIATPCLAIQVPQTDNYILNENDQQVLDTSKIQDPIRDGAFSAIDSDAASKWSGELNGIVGVNNKINDHTTAKARTLQVVKNLINYALGLLSLVALVYLIYNGFLMVTAAGDDAQYKKGLKSIKYAAIAIAGIGLSWLIVSFIFRLITKITTV